MLALRGACARSADAGVAAAARGDAPQPQPRAAAATLQASRRCTAVQRRGAAARCSCRRASSVVAVTPLRRAAPLRRCAATSARCALRRVLAPHHACGCCAGFGADSWPRNRAPFGLSCARSHDDDSADGALAGRSVVVTREAGKNGPLVRRLEQLGIKARASRSAPARSATHTLRCNRGRYLSPSRARAPCADFLSHRRPLPRARAVHRAAADRARPRRGPAAPGCGADVAAVGVGRADVARSCGRLPRGTTRREASALPCYSDANSPLCVCRGGARRASRTCGSPPLAAARRRC
jgi:hypothetical protein